jgi:hypothetical protein
LTGRLSLERLIPASVRANSILQAGLSEFDLDKASIVPTGRNFAAIGLNVEQFVAWHRMVSSLSVRLSGMGAEG